MAHYDIGQIDNKFCKESYRSGQKEAIQFALNAFNNGKKIVIIEAPTGSGKTAIGMTVARFMSDSYYITSNKHLQDQIKQEFQSEIVELKGRNAYPCTLYQLYGDKLQNIIPKHETAAALITKPSCSEGYCKKKAKPSCDFCFSDLPVGYHYSSCPYYEQVHLAQNSGKVLMNAHSFLYQLNLTGDRFQPRELLIIDEAHNLESNLMDFVSCTLNDEILRRYNIIIEEFDTPIEYVDWVSRLDIISILEKVKAKAIQSEDIELADEITDVITKYRFFASRVKTKPDEWVCEFMTKTVKNSKVNSVTFRPVVVSDFIYKYIFKHADKVLLMSATILDVNLIVRALGLDKSQVASHRLSHRFPVKNRPIYIKPAAKMTGGKEKMPLWIPKLIKSVEDISDKYKDVKGIIHTHNFAIANAIIEHSHNKLKNRLLFQKDFESKQQMVDYHAKQNNTIIIAPAMHEGVDLKDDLSRFQIICKVPYPNIYENKQLAARVELEPSYFIWLSALKLCQAVGRSVRSETDYADTYIIDESIFYFLKQSNSILPMWIKESIINI